MERSSGVLFKSRLWHKNALNYLWTNKNRMSKQSCDGLVLSYWWFSLQVQRLRVQSPMLIIHVWRTQYNACDLNTVSRLQLVTLLHFNFFFWNDKHNDIKIKIINYLRAQTYITNQFLNILILKLLIPHTIHSTAFQPLKSAHPPRCRPPKDERKHGKMRLATKSRPLHLSYLILNS